MEKSRWQKIENGYALLWLSEGDLPEEFKPFGKWATSKAQNVFLLGEGETLPWQDTRIPRKLKYPELSESLQIRVIHYKDLHSQTIRFTRYTDFIK